HGGYWHQTDISWWSHLASGAKARGWSVALAGYTLAPQATIPTITGEIAAAVTAIAERHPGPLRLAGHSAGGHLVSRMLCPGILSEAVAARIAQVVSISGVHHLVPLTKAAMNTTLGLTADTARAESPALLPPRVGARATFWVGAGERPEFLRQTRMITERWAEAGAAVRDVYAPGENHFSVIDALSDPESPLISALLSDQ
ncbi:MAG: alpha/beta hydrolase, partial [Pseudomonadota bacterium]